MAKLNIFYSHYNVEGKGNKHRPEFFDYESCFVNLLNTCKNRNIDIHVIMDGKIEENWIKKYKQFYTSHEISGENNSEKITKEVYNVVKQVELKDEDLIYILENDYLHVEGWTEEVFRIYNSYLGLSYISLYDHNDKYFLPQYTDLVSKIITTDSHHWRTTPSTCGSYITTRKIFLEDYDDHTGVTITPGDHHKWVFLSETKSRFILTPIPGLSTHCMEGLMSPTINWKEIVKSIQNL